MSSKLPTISTTTLPDRFSSYVGENSVGFNPLHRDAFLDLRVNSLRDGNVCLSVVMPDTLTRGFVTFLESMLGLMKTADQRTRSAVRQSQPVDLEALAAKEQFKTAFVDRVCTTFDTLTGQGMARNEAISAVNSALKAENHPWATYELIRSILSSSGRLRSRPRANRRSL